MITLQKQKSRPREYRGPEPGSVAILARNPGSKSSDAMIQAMKKDAEFRAQCEEEAKLEKIATIRGNWEISSSNKMVNAAAQRKFDSTKQQLLDNIELRRSNLRQLLHEESMEMNKEVEGSYQTVTERQAILREKARKLKEEKAHDNEMIAKMKYEQMWRDQCEELRTVISKRTADEIKRDNLELIRQKQLMNETSKRFEDEYFAQLWSDNIKKKEEREKQDENRAIERNTETMKILLEQKAIIEEKRRKEKELEAEEQKLRLKMVELKKLEAESSFEAKQAENQRWKEIMDKNLRLKLLRINREKQEEIAFDTKLMEKILAEAESEAGLAAEKQKKIQEESKRYRDYIRHLKLREEAREKELEEVMNEEIKKQWQKRLDQWDKEEAERKRLLLEVINTRQQQIQDKIQKNLEEQRLYQIEREQFAEKVKADRLAEEQKRRDFLEKDRLYRQDLLGQIKYNRSAQEQERLDFELGQQQMADEEALFRERIKATLAEDWVDPRAHPWRQAAAAAAAAEGTKTNTEALLEE